MTGWLIVNEYLNTQKFIELTELFVMAAKETEISLVKYTNADFVVRCDNASILSKAFNQGNPDFIIYYDKDIVLAKAFEKMGLRVFNSASAIEICDSKQKTTNAICNTYLQNDAFLFEDNINVEGNDNPNSIDTFNRNNSNDYQQLGLNTPATFKVPFTYENIGISNTDNFEFLSEIEKVISYPMILKESYSSFGMGVHLANNRDEMIELICRFGSKECLIQEYIKGTDSVDSSRDVRLQMVGDKCVAAMCRKNDNDFRANLTNGGKMTKYEPGEEELRIAREAMKRIGLDFAGIDIMFDLDGKPYFCEANSNAHFKNLYDLTGINAAVDMLKYVVNKVNADK